MGYCLQKLFVRLRVAEKWEKARMKTEEKRRNIVRCTKCMSRAVLNLDVSDVSSTRLCRDSCTVRYCLGVYRHKSMY